MSKIYKRGRWFGRTKNTPGYYHSAKELTDLDEWAENAARKWKARKKFGI